MKKHAYLGWLLLRRDLSERFGGSWAGLSWGLLHPLAQFSAYGLVFGLFLKVQPLGDYAGAGFGAWFCAGLLPWLFVAELMNRSPAQVLGHGRLITRHRFPHLILPAVGLFSAASNHLLWLLGLMVLGPFLGLQWGASLGLLLWFPALLLFGAGLALGASALGVYFRDLSQLSPIVAMLWSLGTPLAYPAEMVPASWQWILRVNPVWPLLDGYRRAFLGLPLDWLALGRFSMWSVFSAALGGWIFWRLSPDFADEL